MISRLPPTVTPLPTGRLVNDQDVWAPADDDHPVERAKENVSTLLSTLAILAVAVGVTWGLWPHWGPWSLCCGGAALALLVSIADQARKPSSRPPAGADPSPTPAHGPPGPTDAGNLHTKGPGAMP